jgi:hypothetical protein
VSFSNLSFLFGVSLLCCLREELLEPVNSPLVSSIAAVTASWRCVVAVATITSVDGRWVRSTGTRIVTIATITVGWWWRSRCCVIITIAAVSSVDRRWVRSTGTGVVSIAAVATGRCSIVAIVTVLALHIAILGRDWQSQDDGKNSEEDSSDGLHLGC